MAAPLQGSVPNNSILIFINIPVHMDLCACQLISLSNKDALKPITADIRVGCAFNRQPVAGKKREATIYTHIHRQLQLWWEAGAPRENPHGPMENMQTH